MIPGFDLGGRVLPMFLATGRLGRPLILTSAVQE